MTPYVKVAYSNSLFSVKNKLSVELESWSATTHKWLFYKQEVRATASEVAKLCKIQKVINYTYFNPKKTHINACKIVHIYKKKKKKKITVTMQICTITVAFYFIF